MSQEKDDCGKKGDGKKDAKDDPMLRSAVHYTVYKISEECAQQFHMQFSKEAVLAIADHIFRNMEHNGRELELFAKHARRTKINPDDVKLLFRNSPDMGPHLDGILKKREQEKRDARPLPTAKLRPTTPKPTTPKPTTPKPTTPKPTTSAVPIEDSPARSPSPEMKGAEEEDEAMEFENDFD